LWNPINHCTCKALHHISRSSEVLDRFQCRLLIKFYSSARLPATLLQRMKCYFMLLIKIPK
jgi:hypothetical protein